MPGGEKKKQKIYACSVFLKYVNITWHRQAYLPLIKVGIFLSSAKSYI